MDSMVSLSRFYKYLTDGNISSINKMFNGALNVNTPLSGSLKDEEGLNILMDNEGSWLRRHLISVELITPLKSENRIVVELQLMMKINGEKIDLPVILIGDIREGLFEKIRIYHSTIPIHGNYKHRETILWPQQQTNPKIVDDYLKGMTNGDLEKVMSLCTDDIVIQESRGINFIHRGLRECKQFFEGILSEGPPVISQSMCMQENRHICMEFVCQSWGKNQGNPMAGCTVLGLSEGKDKIKLIRTYCDQASPGMKT
ncbi:nuclear transport factor 2 family protein [Oceanispirochaeta crateris]|uniref:Nuclear transport factor 2 family protein n=1 Tax=Oceanispirochaeta crateris TaxID=2518645 RepID=A0A5C1QIQ7_9SPIO|nr:nuclear transport factor 2 family protein [Oceanispirochaeta crateris]QEN06920.1 nuclear transport factor 2 family protein [Oceanispirochaeta crateris]